jgi:hypothetical protein
MRDARSGGQLPKWAEPWDNWILVYPQIGSPQLGRQLEQRRRSSGQQRPYPQHIPASSESSMLQNWCRKRHQISFSIIFPFIFPRPSCTEDGLFFPPILPPREIEHRQSLACVVIFGGLLACCLLLPEDFGTLPNGRARGAHHVRLP